MEALFCWRNRGRNRSRVPPKEFYESTWSERGSRSSFIGKMLLVLKEFCQYEEWLRDDFSFATLPLQEAGCPIKFTVLYFTPCPLPSSFAAANFPPPPSIAATKSFDPEPQREIVLSACVNGTFNGCTRSRLKIYTAPASGVEIDGTNTVNVRLPVLQ